jgi:hypothetical protein
MLLGGSVAGGPGGIEVELADTVLVQPVTSTNVNAPRAVRNRAREGCVIGQTVRRPD